MAATDIDPTSLVGRTFDCAFGQFVPRLTVRSKTELRVEALMGTAKIDEVVKVEMTGIRPNLFIMNWTEQNGISWCRFKIMRTGSSTTTHGWPTDNNSAARES